MGKAFEEFNLAAEYVLLSCKLSFQQCLAFLKITGEAGGYFVHCLLDAFILCITPFSEGCNSIAPLSGLQPHFSCNPLYLKFYLYGEKVALRLFDF